MLNCCREKKTNILQCTLKAGVSYVGFICTCTVCAMYSLRQWTEIDPTAWQWTVKRQGAKRFKWGGGTVQAQLMKVGLNHWNSSITTGGKPERIYNPIWRRWMSSVFMLTLFHSLADGDEALIRNWFFWWEGRQLKLWPSDPIARWRCVRRWSSSLRIDCTRPDNHPLPISEAQMCHQCVIEHKS